MIVGALYCKGAIALGIGSFSEPGPGFFPFLMSVFLILLSLIHFLSSLKKSEEFNFAGSKIFWPPIDGIKRILFVVISLFAYAFTMHYLGFVITTFCYIFFLMRFVFPLKWTTVFLGAGLITGVSYAIFELWLRANLPVGLFGF